VSPTGNPGHYAFGQDLYFRYRSGCADAASALAGASGVPYPVVMQLLEVLY